MGCTAVGEAGSGWLIFWGDEEGKWILKEGWVYLRTCKDALGTETIGLDIQTERIDFYMKAVSNISTASNKLESTKLLNSKCNILNVNV